MLDIASHPALKERLVTVDHSIVGIRQGGRVDPDKVKYLIINPHGPSSDFAFPRKVEAHLPQDRALFENYLQSENDSGVYALTRAFLDANPGGVALTVEPSRGVVDANRVKTDAAIRKVLAPEAPSEVRNILAKIHADVLNVIDVVMGALPPHTKNLGLHSMEPFSTPNQPLLAHDNLREFLAAYGTRPLTDATHRPVDIIAGTRDQSPVVDMQMSTIVAELLRAQGVMVGYNIPYDTGPDYPDYGYMTDFPGRVFEADFRKTDLCQGSGEDRSFDTTHPVVDKEKVANIAEVLKEAMSRARAA